MEEAFAGLCQGELPGAALKQADAEIALQHRDIPAHRSGRQGEPPGGGGKASGFGTSDERFEVCQRFHPPLSSDDCKLFYPLPTNHAAIKMAISAPETTPNRSERHDPTRNPQDRPERRPDPGGLSAGPTRPPALSVRQPAQPRAD